MKVTATFGLCSPNPRTGKNWSLFTFWLARQFRSSRLFTRSGKMVKSKSKRRSGYSSSSASKKSLQLALKSRGMAKGSSKKGLDSAPISEEWGKAAKTVTRNGKVLVKTGIKAYKVARAAKKTFQKGWKGHQKVLKGFAKTGAITYPGTHYMGPGNQLDMGPPRSYADTLAYVHDHQYSQLEKKGVDVYFTFNKADAELLKKVSPTKTSLAPLYYAMTAKRVLPVENTPVQSVPPYAVKYKLSPLNTPGAKAWKV